MYFAHFIIITTLLQLPEWIALPKIPSFRSCNYLFLLLRLFKNCTLCWRIETESRMHFYCQTSNHRCNSGVVLHANCWQFAAALTCKLRITGLCALFPKPGVGHAICRDCFPSLIILSHILSWTQSSNQPS